MPGSQSGLKVESASHRIGASIDRIDCVICAKLMWRTSSEGWWYSLWRPFATERRGLLSLCFILIFMNGIKQSASRLKISPLAGLMSGRPLTLVTGMPSLAVVGPNARRS